MICSCNICKCKCTANFARDKLQRIYLAKMQEQEQKQEQNQSRPSSVDTETHQSVIEDYVKTISDSAANTLLYVIQIGESPRKTNNKDQKFKSSQMKDTFDRAIGVSSYGLTKNEGIFGNQKICNKLREELGGTPTTLLHSTGESVAQYNNRNGKDTSSSRESRNNLIDLFETDETDKSGNKNDDDKKQNSNALLKQCVNQKRLQRFRETRDGQKRQRLNLR